MSPSRSGSVQCSALVEQLRRARHRRRAPSRTGVSVAARALPARYSRAGVRRGISIEPSSGSSWPTSTFISVDLPAPLRPISPTRPPGGDRRRGAVEDRAAAEAHGDVVDGDHAARAPSRHGSLTQPPIASASPANSLDARRCWSSIPEVKGHTKWPRRKSRNRTPQASPGPEAVERHAQGSAQVAQKTGRPRYSRAGIDGRRGCGVVSGGEGRKREVARIKPKRKVPASVVQPN